MTAYINTRKVESFRDSTDELRKLVEILKAHDIDHKLAVDLVYDAYDLGFARADHVHTHGG